MGTVRVEGYSSLARDDESSAIVNTDMNAYQLAKRRKLKMQTQTNEINNLKEEVGEIKNLLHTILEKLNG
jgi:hypothetical protein|tara:strand:+ start:90 stop:299 length:210 start_codon:yes stop_codon:yes gene_type:complete